MAETNAVPTTAEVTAVRADVANYLTGSLTVDNYTAYALAQFKLDLEDKRGVKFTQVFDTTNDKYFLDTDDNTRNDDKCIYMLSLLTISRVFRDFAIAQEESQWWDLANEYETRYDERLKIAQLDVDADEDGSIDEDEERTSGQKFMVK